MEQKNKNIEKKDKILYPGSFEPFHNGHLELLKVALDYFEEVEILVANNNAKTYTWTPTKRKALVIEVLKNILSSEEYKRVKVNVLKTSDSTADYAHRKNYKYILRGVNEIKRIGSFYEVSKFETNLLAEYHESYPELSTFYVLTDLNISSSLIKQQLSISRPISDYVDQSILEEVKRTWMIKS